MIAKNEYGKICASKFVHKGTTRNYKEVFRGTINNGIDKTQCRNVLCKQSHVAYAQISPQCLPIKGILLLQLQLASSCFLNTIIFCATSPCAQDGR